MPLDTSLEICTSEDVGRAFTLAIEYRNHLSKIIFNLGGGINCRTSYKDFLQRYFEEVGLGKFNFPLKTFAEKNFHCGYYADGDFLDNIIHFRSDSLNDYFGKVKKSTPKCKKMIASIFKNQIKNYLFKKSEPFQAFVSGDSEMIQHYFKNLN